MTEEKFATTLRLEGINNELNTAFFMSFFTHSRSLQTNNRRWQEVFRGTIHSFQRVFGENTHTYLWFCLYQNLDVQLHRQAAQTASLWPFASSPLYTIFITPHRTQTLLAVCSCCCRLFVCSPSQVAAVVVAGIPPQSLIPPTTKMITMQRNIYLQQPLCPLCFLLHLLHTHIHIQIRVESAAGISALALSCPKPPPPHPEAHRG